MSENTLIELADHTFNPWEGCQKVGPGCDHCYAEARNARFGGGQAVNWGPGAPRRRTSVSNWRKPVLWNTNAAAFQAEHGRRQRLFCASLADVFDNQVDPAWRADLFQLIADTPNGAECFHAPAPPAGHDFTRCPNAHDPQCSFPNCLCHVTPPQAQEGGK